MLLLKTEGKPTKVNEAEQDFSCAPTEVGDDER